MSNPTPAPNDAPPPSDSPSQTPLASPTEPGAPEQATSERHEGMVRSAFVVGVMTILSRVLGLWRFRLMGGLFGATGVADAFNFAFILPNLTRRLFGEGLLTSAFVPVFSDRLAKGEKDAANRTGAVLLSRLAYWLTLGCVGMIALSAVARMVLPNVMKLPPHIILELKLFEAMLPYMVFINLAAVLMAILNALGHFLMPAFAPVLLNVLMILACYFGLPLFGTEPSEQIWAVAIAVLIGGVLQFAIQMPPAIARGFKFNVNLDKNDPGYREVMDNFKPVVLLVAVFQLNVLLDNIIAQTLIPGTGPVTYLNMGTSVYQLPWSIIALALGTVALPALSKLWALADRESFKSTLLHSLRLSIFLSIPCTVGIMMMSEDIVRLLYGTGKFLENDGEPVRRTAKVVMFSSLGLVFFSVNAILSRALYAMKDMRTPTTTTFKSVGLNLALNLVFVLGTPMQESGIALASTISNAWQTWMLMNAVREKLGMEGSVLKERWRFFLQVFGSAAFAAFAAYLAHEHFSKSKDQESFYAFFWALGVGTIPFWLIGRWYVTAKLSDKPQEPEEGAVPLYRYNVKEEHWSEGLKLEHCIFVTALSSAVMGFFVWAVRDSLPPEGSIFPSVFQRTAVPVAVGVMVYSMAAGGLMAREYEELRNALWVRLWKKKKE